MYEVKADLNGDVYITHTSESGERIVAIMCYPPTDKVGDAELAEYLSAVRAECRARAMKFAAADEMKKLCSDLWIEFCDSSDPVHVSIANRARAIIKATGGMNA